ncbi:hypothetical protein DSM100238_1269 [Bifidobacterium apri]|uniref:Uncharacterized protein n=1 Tax=Bifidobacterium apri TaxID=1769423 RepID=A0A6A2V7T3_9BIFI|nr:hypothetical protein DSM100238_1269 [Bifidobacterium apri]
MPLDVNHKNRRQDIVGNTAANNKAVRCVSRTAMY